MPRRAVVWYRRDLRIDDHPALRAALDEADEIIPLFVLDPELLGGRGVGANRRSFLTGALRSLDRDLRTRGGRLFVRVGDPVEVVPAVAAATGASSVHCSREFTPYAIRRDQATDAALNGRGVRLAAHSGNYLTDFDELMTGSGSPFKVYTPFARAARAVPWETPVTAPSRVVTPAVLGDEPVGMGQTGDPSTTMLELLLGQVDTAGRADGAAQRWPADPGKALERLTWFGRNRIGHYDGNRDLPGRDGTSKLSPYLRLGLVSPRQVVAGARAHAPDRAGRGLDTYLGELLWRDFYAYVLYHNPHSAWQDLRPEFAELTWEDDPEGVDAWRRGHTGYPLVDAGMRQLTATGWMHNRVRMVVASFLCKDLLVDWRVGARFFLEHLVDGDLASNNGGWQWAASTGTDAQPWYRIFNPVKQSERFDPSGEYLREWVPELAEVRGPGIHEPWLLEARAQRLAGIRVGVDYPRPVVDHKQARERTLARFRAVRGD